MKKLEIKPYNEKSFVVIGSETKKLATQLKSLGGRFCFLPATEKEHEGYYQPSWVFSVNRYNTVLEQLQTLLETTKQQATKQQAKAPAASKPAKEPAKKVPVRIKPITF